MRSLQRLPVATPVIAAVLVVTVLVPTRSDAQSIEDARRQRVALQERLNEAAEQLNAIETRVAELEAQRNDLASQVDQLEAEAAAAAARINTRLRGVYMFGGTDPLLQLISGSDPERALESATRVTQLVRGDKGAAEVAIAARVRADTTRETLVAREAELAEAVATQESVLAGLSQDLSAAQALEDRLIEEERERQAEQARREAAAAAAAAAEAAAAAGVTPTSNAGPPAVPSGGIACPMGQPHSFTDTWGAPRSGGRSHKGVDILSPYGTPVYAFTSGVWDVRSPGRLAGNWGILRGDDGNNYYYMHLQTHTAGDGARVNAGTQVGTNGDTGNARGTPHLHWEVHPGGGGAVNPTPFARRACG